MNFVVFDALDADRLKSSQSDVECDFRRFDAALADAVENFRGEVEARGRSCYGATLLGVNGLIAFAVAKRIWTRNVGWEWDVSDAIEDGVEIIDWSKAERAPAELGAGNNFCLQVIVIAKK